MLPNYFFNLFSNKKTKLLVLSTFILGSGCTHMSEGQAQKPEWTEDVRMAQAQIDSQKIESKTIKPVQGEVNFEQMPNSVIVTYRIEGLEPKSMYQLFLYENQDCNSLDSASAEPLMKLRANSDGIAENTFKNTNIAVSGKQNGKQALQDDVVVLRSMEPKTDTPAQIACGEVLPQNPGMALQ